jgi:hypothetical protein
MGMQFYAFEGTLGKFEHPLVDVEQVDLNNELSPRCPQCGEGTGSRTWLPPYRVALVVERGGLTDVAFAPGMDLLFSSPLLENWNAAGLRGLLGQEPVEIVKLRPKRYIEQAPRYFHAFAGRTTTRIDEQRSGVVRRGVIYCEFCKSGSGINWIDGFAIDESTWSGDDIFVPWGLSGIIVVSDRVRELRDEHGMTGAVLIPVEQYVWDPHRKLGKQLH